MEHIPYNLIFTTKCNDSSILITIISWYILYYLNLSLASKYVDEVTIPTQVIMYNLCCSRRISLSDCSIHIKLNYLRLHQHVWCWFLNYFLQLSCNDLPKKVQYILYILFCNSPSQIVFISRSNCVPKCQFICLQMKILKEVRIFFVWSKQMSYCLHKCWFSISYQHENIGIQTKFIYPSVYVWCHINTWTEII